MNIGRLIGEDEIDVVSCLRNITSFNANNSKIIRKIYKYEHYYDEPKYFKYRALLKDVGDSSDGVDYTTNASGYSFNSEDEALLKCIGEAVERFSIKVYKDNDLIRESYIGLGAKALNPRDIISFSDAQKRGGNFAIFNFDKSSNFRWVKAFSLTLEKKIFVPAQLIYFSYKRLPNEKMIRFPMSSGSAGGGCLSGAICRGIYELVERDGFIIHYMNRLLSPKVDLENIKDEKIHYILGYLKRYLLEVHTFDISTDLGIPSFMTIVIDRTGIGPAISVGLKARLNYHQAIIGSIEESLNAREWIRREFEYNKTDITKISRFNMKDLTERGLYWFPKEKIKLLNYLLNQKANIPKYKQVELPTGKQLSTLIKIFKKNNFNLIYKDLTLPEIKKLGYSIVTVVIPELQPLFLKEKYPYLGGTRLYTTPSTIGLKKHKTTQKSLNQNPHPFL